MFADGRRFLFVLHLCCFDREVKEESPESPMYPHLVSGDIVLTYRIKFSRTMLMIHLHLC